MGREETSPPGREDTLGASDARHLAASCRRTRPSRGTLSVTSWTLPLFVSSTVRCTTPLVPPFTVGLLESVAGLLDVTELHLQGLGPSPIRLALRASESY